MSAYLQQEFDFINRTKLILDQYDDCFRDRNKSDKYEVTLLINCFVGLLILPEQHWFDHLPEELINRKDWGIDPAIITYINPKETKTVSHVARHLRNSVSHYNFRAFNNKKEEISQIRFEDYLGNHKKNNKNKKKKTFDATIPISNIRMFLNKFSETMARIMVEQN